jgi:hypothetical protein
VKEVLHRVLVWAVEGIEDIEMLGDHQRYPAALKNKTAPRIGVDDLCSGGRGNVPEKPRSTLIRGAEPGNFSVNPVTSENVNEAS